MSTVQSYKGIITGKTIQLEHEPPLSEGQAVTVTIEPAEPTKPLPPGEGLRRAFGGWADDPEGLDAYLEWNRQQRKAGRRELS